jgi:hypothetical protein
MARHRAVAAATALVAIPLVTAVIHPSLAAAAPAAPTAPGTVPTNDVRELDRKDFTVEGRKLNLPNHYEASAATQRRTQAAVDTPPVGTVREWLALDDVAGNSYRKPYTLRGVGKYIEVWVANDTSFPAGDCRNQVAGSTTVTDKQVNDLITQFDTNMYPKETATFSTPPDRDGTKARVPGDFTGAGNRTVTLVDNVRDDNYYQFPARPTYIAGFFSAAFNEAMDRNIMTVDAYDWAHRTGANPADQPTNDLCTSRPARPRLYEGTFAHEWQHLLQYYVDPQEVTWVNEGLSDFAQTLVGYVNGTKTVYDRGGDSHIYCFQGFGPVKTAYNTNPRDCGGPQNSLNLWGEGDPNALLADYGNAYQFMLYLYDHYGTTFMAKLHKDGKRQGLASLAALLKERGVKNVYQVIHDFQTMTLVDKIVEAKKGKVAGVPKARVTSKSVRSTVNLANPQANSWPGAAPNGADYVQLKAKGKVLRGRDLKSVKFSGSATLPSLPLTWTVVSNDPARPDNPVLFSGNDSNTDAGAVTPVTVPAGTATLKFQAKYGAETGYDYGYVIVSTDGGKTYKAVAGDKTVAGPLGPGLNGSTNNQFVEQTFDLSAYAGKKILLGFRYVSDGGVNEGGLLIDDVTINGTVISDGSSLTPFKSITQIYPVRVNNWNVRLVGLDVKHALALQLQYNGKRSLTVSSKDLKKLAKYPTVVAIIAYDEPTEQVQQYAPYTLTVNGAVQPGGRATR